MVMNFLILEARIRNYCRSM